MGFWIAGGLAVIAAVGFVFAGMVNAMPWDGDQ